MTPDKLLCELESLITDRLSLTQSLKSIIKNAFVEKFGEGYERPCEERDFSGRKESRQQQIGNIKLIFQKLISSGFFIKDGSKTNSRHPDFDNDLLAVMLILCGENASLELWNTKTIVTDCNEILFEVLKLFCCNNVSDLIMISHKIHIIRDTMQNLTPNLLKNTWKHFPASVVCYKWILEKIRQPNLSSYLPTVLPIALLLVDDFVNENKITGIICLNHIIENVTTAELQFCGHGDVIYNALLPLLRIRESDIISPLIPCLVHLTTKLEMDFGRKDVNKWSKFDDILEIYLENMELENLIALRNSYISNLGFLFDSSGFGIIRWSKRLLRIFNEYLEVADRHNDSKTSNSCLKAMEKYLEVTKDLIPIYGKNLFFAFLIVFNSTCKDAAQIENRTIATKCITKLLDSISQSDKDALKIELEKNFSNNEQFNQFYKQVCDIVKV